MAQPPTAGSSSGGVVNSGRSDRLQTPPMRPFVVDAPSSQRSMESLPPSVASTRGAGGGARGHDSATAGGGGTRVSSLSTIGSVSSSIPTTYAAPPSVNTTALSDDDDDDYFGDDGVMRRRQHSSSSDDRGIVARLARRIKVFRRKKNGGHSDGASDYDGRTKGSRLSFDRAMHYTARELLLSPFALDREADGVDVEVRRRNKLRRHGANAAHPWCEKRFCESSCSDDDDEDRQFLFGSANSDLLRKQLEEDRRQRRRRRRPERLTIETPSTSTTSGSGDDAHMLVGHHAGNLNNDDHDVSNGDDDCSCCIQNDPPACEGAGLRRVVALVEVFAPPFSLLGLLLSPVALSASGLSAIVVAAVAVFCCWRSWASVQGLCHNIVTQPALRTHEDGGLNDVGGAGGGELLGGDGSLLPATTTEAAGGGGGFQVVVSLRSYQKLAEAVGGSRLRAAVAVLVACVYLVAAFVALSLGVVVFGVTYHASTAHSTNGSSSCEWPFHYFILGCTGATIALSVAARLVVRRSPSRGHDARKKSKGDGDCRRAKESGVLAFWNTGCFQLLSVVVLLGWTLLLAFAYLQSQQAHSIQQQHQEWQHEDEITAGKNGTRAVIAVLGGPANALEFAYSESTNDELAAPGLGLPPFLRSIAGRLGVALCNVVWLVVALGFTIKASTHFAFQPPPATPGSSMMMRWRNWLYSWYLSGNNGIGGADGAAGGGGNMFPRQQQHTNESFENQSMAAMRGSMVGTAAAGSAHAAAAAGINADAAAVEALATRLLASPQAGVGGSADNTTTVLAGNHHQQRDSSFSQRQNGGRHRTFAAQFGLAMSLYLVSAVVVAVCLIGFPSLSDHHPDPGSDGNQSHHRNVAAPPPIALPLAILPRKVRGIILLGSTNSSTGTGGGRLLGNGAKEEEVSVCLSPWLFRRGEVVRVPVNRRERMIPLFVAVFNYAASAVLLLWVPGFVSKAASILAAPLGSDGHSALQRREAVARRLDREIRCEHARLHDDEGTASGSPMSSNTGSPGGRKVTSFLEGLRSFFMGDDGYFDDGGGGTVGGGGAVGSGRHTHKDATGTLLSALSVFNVVREREKKRQSQFHWRPAILECILLRLPLAALVTAASIACIVGGTNSNESAASGVNGSASTWPHSATMGMALYLRLTLSIAACGGIVVAPLVFIIPGAIAFFSQRQQRASIVAELGTCQTLAARGVQVHTGGPAVGTGYHGAGGGSAPVFSASSGNVRRSLNSSFSTAGNAFLPPAASSPSFVGGSFGGGLSPGRTPRGGSLTPVRSRRGSYAAAGGEAAPLLGGGGGTSPSPSFASPQFRPRADAEDGSRTPCGRLCCGCVAACCCSPILWLRRMGPLLRYRLSLLLHLATCAVGVAALVAGVACLVAVIQQHPLGSSSTH